MGKLTPKQQQALAWYVEEHNLIPQMSTPPVFWFKHRETHEETQAHIMSIVSQFDVNKKKDKEA